ncbi:MAG: MarR family transcriptional regulator [Solobacterium sp.]|nr:MarR family transcriptional regulator [Solobacterium sp.]
MNNMDEDRKIYKVPDDGTLAYLFFHTAHKIRQYGRPGFSRQKLLSILEEMGPMSQQKIQEMLGIKPGSLSELCAKMEDKGLIGRTRDENDRRRMVIRIKEEGRRKRREIENTKDDYLFAALNESERSELRQLLYKLYMFDSAIDEMNREAGDET